MELPKQELSLSYMNHFFARLSKNTEKDANEILKLEVDGKVYLVHRILYISLSDFFRTLIESQNFLEAKCEIKSIKSIKASTFDTINKAVYGGQLDINNENLVDLLSACDYLQLSFFYNRIEDYILVNIEELDSVLLDLHCCPTLQLFKDAYNVVLNKLSSKFFKVPVDGLLKLSYEDLQLILSSPHFKISSYSDLNKMKKICQQWILHNPSEARYKYLFDLVKFIFSGVNLTQDFEITVTDLLNNEKSPNIETLNIIILGLWSHIIEDAELQSVPSSNFGKTLLCFRESDNDISEFNGETFYQGSNICLPEAVSKVEDVNGLVDRDIYISRFKNNVSSFFVYNPTTTEWLLLNSSSCRILDLLACNNKIISYQTMIDKPRNQFFTFEKHLNQWFEVPYNDKLFAGVTSDKNCLYSLGQSNNAEQNLSVEFYDFRTNTWSSMKSSQSRLSELSWKPTPNNNHHKQVVIGDNKFYFFQENKAFTFDFRNHCWTFRTIPYVKNDDSVYVTKWKNYFYYFKSNYIVYNLQYGLEDANMHRYYNHTSKPFNMY